jgi:NADH dehydrogenase/NADH:ubiquinone oxidoreductase subunit G
MSAKVSLAMKAAHQQQDYVVNLLGRAESLQPLKSSLDPFHQRLLSMDLEDAKLLKEIYTILASREPHEGPHL